MNDEADSNICIQCGLCCDGTLFSKAEIFDDESIDPTFDFEIYQENDQRKYFDLGCRYLQGKCCQIYEKRPYKICDKFACYLLKAYNLKHKSRQEAIAIISEMINLKNEIVSYLSKTFPESVMSSFYKSLEEFDILYQNESTLDFKKAHQTLFLNIWKFQYLKKKDFFDPQREYRKI